ncbi:Cleavage stimulation factor subunit 3 [Thelohanellus kitauei]|uniref:Cleavage stimulation factor subunit 3 n=1 Tax=Thelohanellus kitauei TaxID=669202 RepID=A0A0C2IDI9_THEKT|nr:Cleavage stimulation factor subunit 3 [Thelohanellus kitauei]
MESQIVNMTNGDQKFWSIEDKGRKAEEHIRNEDQFDVNSWMILIREAQIRSIHDARIMFEKAMAQFPGCYRFLKLYLEKEMREGDIEHLDKVLCRLIVIRTLFAFDSQYRFVSILSDPCQRNQSEQS